MVSKIFSIVSFLSIFILIFVVQLDSSEDSRKTYIQRGNVRIEIPSWRGSAVYTKVLVGGKPIGTVRIGARVAQKNYKEWQSEKCQEYEIKEGKDFETIVATLVATYGAMTVTTIQETTVKDDGIISIRVVARSNNDFMIQEVGVPFVLTEPERWAGATVSLRNKDELLEETKFPPSGESETLLHSFATEIRVVHPESGEVRVTTKNKAQCYVQDGRKKSWIAGYCLLVDATNVELLANQEKELFEIEIRIVPPKTASSVINIIRNGSFEIATNGPTSTNPGLPDGFNTYYILSGTIQKGVLPGAFIGIDETNAVHGNRSLKISFPQGIDAKPVYLCTPYYRVMSEMNYTLSVSIKSDKEGFPIKFTFPGLNTTIKTSTKWERYSFTFKTPAESICSGLYISFDDVEAIKNGVTLWFDALQLEIGEVANPYKDTNIPLYYSDSNPFVLGTVPSITAVYTVHPPNIDGILDEPEWKKSSKLEGFLLMDGSRKPSESTEAYVLIDNNNLYIAVVCYDSKLKVGNVISKIEEDEEEIFGCDTVEVFIDPTHNYKNYFHFAVDLLGRKYDAKIQDKSWNTDWMVAVKHNNKKWIVEMAIPLSVLGWDPDPNGSIGLNICRVLHRTNEFIAWSPTGSNFHVPERFGILTGLKTFRTGVATSIRIGRGLSLLKNNEIFFPLGLYTVPDFAFSEVKKAGFNSVIAYEGYYNPYGKTFDKEKLQSYLDNAQKNGIFVLLSLCRNYYVAWRRRADEPNLSNIADMITMFKNHPALLGYYIADEPYGDSFRDAVNKVNSLVKKLDPEKITMLVLCNIEETIRFKDSADILGFDIYPIPSRPVSLVSKTMDAARAILRDEKPVWLVAQAFGGQESWFREPTPQEARCMAYLGIVHGAKGLFWFTYKPSYEPLWNELAKLNKEITELAPILLAEGPVSVGRLIGTPSVHYWCREFADKIVIIAVNESLEACEASFTVMGYVSKVEEMFEKRNLIIKDGSFKDNFIPQGTHVYIIKK